MIPFHPYAEIFELIEGSDFSGLVEDIRRFGLRERIVVWEDKILDGRNRYRAAIAAGLVSEDDEPNDRPTIFQQFTRSIDGDPLSFVISKNVHRRHLSISQRAYAMAEVESFRHGGQRIEQDANLQLEQAAATRAELANKGHVSERSIASAAVVRDQGADDLKTAVRQGSIAVSAAERIARLPMEEQVEEVRRHLPNGARAIMSSRHEPDDSLDYFPTPPWATRALMERVMPHLGIRRFATAWEPATGEGHMAEVLSEYFERVLATDVFDYGYGAQFDFLNDDPSDYQRRDWIVTNPPFDEKAAQFVLRALDLSNVGVAMFFRLQWIPTVGRYEKIFRDFPPTLVAFFCERVNLCKGRWDPTGSTATDYIWLVWRHGDKPRAPFWIPPGCREALSKPDDAERFTTNPVTKKDHVVRDESFDASTGEIVEPIAAAPPPESEIEPIPGVFRRGTADCFVNAGEAK